LEAHTVSERPYNGHRSAHRVSKNPRRPSAKKAAASARQVLGIVAFILLVFSVLFVIFGVSDYDAHRFASEARLATATVRSNVLHPAGVEGYARTVYDVDYVFTAADGTRVESKDRLDDAALARGWDHLKLGDTIPVTYAADNPQNRRMGTDTSTRTLDLMLAGLAGVWLVLASITVAVARSWWLAHLAAGSHKSAVPSAGTDPPRRAAARVSVSASTAFGMVLLSCGAIFLLIGVVNLVSILSTNRAFRTQSKAATAIVLVKSSTTNRGGEISYGLVVRFATDEAKSVLANISVDRATSLSLHEHYPIKIIYLPEQPTRIRLTIDQPGPPPFLWFLTALAGVLTVAGAILLGFGISDARRRGHRGGTS
jgi:hypothetical protein